MAKTIRSSGHEALRDALVAGWKAAGLTHEQLADRLKCHQSVVAWVESGERRIDVIELIVLARSMAVDASTLLAKAEGATDADGRIVGSEDLIESVGQ